MPKKVLKAIPGSEVEVLKLRNRRGYAAICLGNLTEGKSAADAVARLKNPLKRMGLEIKGRVRGV